MAEVTVRDSARRTNITHGDLVTLKLSPRQAFRLAMNLLEECRAKVEAEGQADYTTNVTFAAEVSVYP